MTCLLFLFLLDFSFCFVCSAIDYEKKNLVKIKNNNNNNPFVRTVFVFTEEAKLDAT